VVIDRVVSPDQAGDGRNSRSSRSGFSLIAEA
jgi:hypothetical protein